MSAHPPRIAVIGAGWAGLAAAIELSDRGAKVVVFERSRTLGGRARAVPGLASDPARGHVFDNGQHILLGAYSTTLGLMQRVGLDIESTLLREPLQMHYPDGFSFEAKVHGTSLHLLAGLLRARGMSVPQRLQLARKLAGAALRGWRCDPGMTVAQWLQDQPHDNVMRIWEPLCLSAMNTPMTEASAQVFLNILRDALTSGRGGSDMLIPRTNLSTLFPSAAAASIHDRGGEVRAGESVVAISRDTHNGWQIDTSGAQYQADGIVLATPPRPAARLLRPLGGLEPLCRQLDGFDYAPITTVYLPDPGIRLSRPMLALQCDPAREHFGQYVFDQGSRTGHGLWAVVISVSECAGTLSREALGRAVCAQLAEGLKPLIGNAAEQLRNHETFVITEKHATFRCTPRLVRPANRTPMTGLVLAGDYTDGPYPATLEGATRSGTDAAHVLMPQIAG